MTGWLVHLLLECANSCHVEGMSAGMRVIPFLSLFMGHRHWGIANLPESATVTVPQFQAHSV